MFMSYKFRLGYKRFFKFLKYAAKKQEIFKLQMASDALLSRGWRISHEH